MRSSLFSVLFFSLFQYIFSEFSYLKDLENSSFAKEKNLENKISNIFSYYKDVIKDKSIHIKDTALMEKLKSEVGNLISDKNSKPFSFIQQDQEESQMDDQKMFTYQPFVMTKFFTKFNPPSQRRGHTTLIADTFLLIFGGCYQEFKCFNDLYFLDLRSHKWIEVPTLGQKPSPRGGHAAILYGTTLWVFGGNSEQGYLNDVFSLNLETREWNQEFLEGEAPSPRTNIVGVKDDQGRMIIFGGFTEVGYDNTLYVLNLIDKKFEKPLVSGILPSRREQYGMVYLNSRVWLFGGFQEGGVLNDFFSIDTYNWTWIKVETSGPKPPACQGMSITRVGKKLYVTGGCDVRKKKCYSNIYILDTDSLWWTEIQTMKSPMQPRESYTSVFFRGHIYSFGGCQLYQFCFNDIFIMNVNDWCPNKCNSKGICKKELGCACNIGFTEHDCSMRTKCKKDCSGNGFCNNNAKCGCYLGFTGPSCEVNLNCPKNCTSIDNGQCTQNGTCVCKDGFGGTDCSEITSCDVLYAPPNFNITNLNVSNIKNYTTSEINNLNNVTNKTNNSTNKTLSETKDVNPINIKQRLMDFELKLRNISNNSMIRCGNSSNITKKLNKTSIQYNLSQRIKKYKEENQAESKKFMENLIFNSKIPIFLQTHSPDNTSSLEEINIIKSKINSTQNNSSRRKSRIKGDDDDSPKKKGGEDDDDVGIKKKVILTEGAEGYISGDDKNKRWFLSKECETNCSNRGVCLNKTCFCQQGFTFKDCSLSYKDFTLLGYKFKDMIIILIIAFVFAVALTAIFNIYRRNKLNEDYLELD